MVFTEETLIAPLACTLAGFSLLSISGNERHSFLHGQFINDLNLIEKPGAQLSAWCNPKGQVIANFLIINTGIAYLLIFKEDLKPFVQKRLNMFVLRSDVQIEDISEQSPLLGVANTNDLSSFGLNTSIAVGEVVATEGLVVTHLPYAVNHYLIMGNKEILEKKTSELKSSLTIVDSSIWELLDILAGLPWITSSIQEQFLPQMLNLDSLNGLSYQKGCYPGQEIIARLHYRGEVKKRVQLIKSEVQLQQGENVNSGQSDKNIGSIINSAMHPDGLYYALAVLELDKLNEKLQCNAQAITLLDLPYAIES